MNRTTLALRVACLAACFTVVSLATPARAVTYAVTILQPATFANSQAFGVSNTNQVGSGSGPSTGGLTHALIWSGTPASFVDLHPAGLFSSYAVGVSGANQAGYGSGTATGNNSHAMLWSGTAASVVDLNPATLDVSYALDISGTSQVGYGFNDTDFQNHALLWTGSAASVVDLTPDGFSDAFANGVSGTMQAGYGYGPATNFDAHALLWTSTAASKVDLHPTGFVESVANDVSGATQVGWGRKTTAGNPMHALLWSSTAASVVDLNPAGYSTSVAVAVSSTKQVGNASGTASSGLTHAMVWSGTAASALDLHTFLPAGMFNESYAQGITEDGSIVGYGDLNGVQTALLWSPAIIEPGVPGDYNSNGTVDAADYIMWRNGTNPLSNEVATLGSNTPEDYTAWRARVGNTAGSGSAQPAAVPEPASTCLIILEIVAASTARGRVSTRREIGRT